MSYLSFLAHSSSAPHRSAHQGSLRAAFARWILANHGGGYRATLGEQRARRDGRRFRDAFANSRRETPTAQPLVGIVGGGFAGLFAGLILRSLGVECDLYESSERVGGRIRTWYSTD
jgi:monoamine oxidase